MALRLCRCSFFTLALDLVTFISFSFCCTLTGSLKDFTGEVGRSGCGLLDEAHQYYATLEGVDETLQVGQLIPGGFASYGIKNVTILSTSYLKYLTETGASRVRLFNTRTTFIEPRIIDGPVPGAQRLQFRLLTSLSEYLRTATSSVIEFVYRLNCHCADAHSRGSTVDGTLLLDIRDVNNVPPVFRVQKAADPDEDEDQDQDSFVKVDAIPRYFIDLRAYEEHPHSFNYKLASVSRIFVLDGDYMPANGQLEVVDCRLEDGLFDCGQLVQIELKRQDGQGYSGVVGSVYELKFKLVKEFDELLYSVTNASQLAANLTLTDGVHQAFMMMQFEFVGRAADAVVGRGVMGGWLNWQMVVYVLIGGTCLTVIWFKRVAIMTLIKPRKEDSSSPPSSPKEVQVQVDDPVDRRDSTQTGSWISDDFKASVHSRPQLPPELRA